MSEPMGEAIIDVVHTLVDNRYFSSAMHPPMNDAMDQAMGASIPYNMVNHGRARGPP